jgi:hypothetical protein
VTTNTLAKHYGALSAAERLALMMAAGARGDDVEHARLADAAPRVDWRVPHTFGRALAFLGVFSQHRMERLDLVALFFKTSALADTATGKLAERLRGAVGLYGYLVRVHADGWARFCAREHLDPTVCESLAPGSETLEHAAREADVVGFTVDEARAYLRRDCTDASDSLKTADSVAESLHAAFTFLRAQWE